MQVLYITHPYVNLILAFPKVASSHPHYLTFTLHTYHHPEYRFRAYADDVNLQLVSCVHPVAVLNAAFCMTCSLLMLVEDARGDHMEESYSRAGLMTAF